MRNSLILLLLLVDIYAKICISWLMLIYNDNDDSKNNKIFELVFYLLLFSSIFSSVFGKISTNQVLGFFREGGVFLSNYNTLIVPVFSFGIASYLVYIVTSYTIYLNHLKQNKKIELEEKTHHLFYQLLEEKNGYVTVLDLAMKAKITSTQAKDFLQDKIKSFNHKVILSKDGEMAYKFDYLTKEEIKELEQPFDNFPYGL